MLASSAGPGLAHLTGTVSQINPPTTLQVMSSPSAGGGNSQHSATKENMMPRSNYEEVIGLQELISMNQGIKNRFEQLKGRTSGLGNQSSVNSNKY